ncbi:MAG: bifunctional nuclease domain-containing protein [Phycisphaerae bacterium]
MELSRVLITELGDQQVIFLKEKGGERSFPIVIGIAEALAIDRRLKGVPMPRPMTHDLMANVIESLGGTVERVVIHDLQDHTFLANLYIRRGDEVIPVDSRPSDAIALGVASETPIFVSEKVLRQVSEPATMEDRIELLRRRKEMLEDQIAELSSRLEDESSLQDASEESVSRQRRQLREMRKEYDAIDEVLRKFG